MNLNPIVRERLEALADHVERHGEGVLRGTSESNPFSLSQAETYLRWYEGLKRENQTQSIESCLIEPDDPLYGWGWLAQHEPYIQVTGPNQQHDIPLTGAAFRREELKQKRLQAAELIVVKRPIIMPTIAMQIIHAIVEPIVIPDLLYAGISARISKVKSQVKSPGIVERMNCLRYLPYENGVKIFLGESQTTYEIGMIDK